MGNLFLKIFLWFWLTVIIVAVTLIGIMFGTRSEDSIRRDVSSKLSIYTPVEARRAADIYERQGKDGLKNHFVDLGESDLLEPFLLNQNGEDVLGHRPPQRALRFAKNAKTDAPLLGNFPGPDGFAAQEVIGDSGREYTLLLVLTRSPLLILLKGFGASTLWSVLAVLLIGGAFCFWLASHIATPVIRLSNTASQIASGSLETRSDGRISSRHDEIGRLAKSFDRMAERIEILVRGQQRLLGDVSHELRSPLARLSVAEGLLRQCPPEERAEYMDRIELEVEHLDHLIGQLLTLTLIETGANLGRQEGIELSSLIQEVAADGDFEAHASRRSVQIDRLEVCTVIGVAEQLRRAFENVVRNAIRYTGAGKTVHIQMQRHKAGRGNTVVVSVRDHGPGVPEEYLKSILQPFYRAPHGDGEEISGTGLGLAITDRIMKMFGGSVRAVNAADGGLVVLLELPLSE